MRVVNFSAPQSQTGEVIMHLGRDPKAGEDLTDTLWSGIDSEDDYYEFMFCRGGILRYISYTGRFASGRWQQEGANVYFEINSRYSQYRGTIEANGIMGEGQNVAGRHWKWFVSRK